MTQPEPLEETALIAQELIRFDTTNFGEGRANGETDAAEYLGALLEGLGLTTEYVDAAPGRTSVVARVKGADATKPALVVHGHTDVVPADPTNWSVDPFGGVVRHGMLWGRGAVDMKNMDAMIITALQDILGAGREPSRDLVIAFFSDEEMSKPMVNTSMPSGESTKLNVQRSPFDLPIQFSCISRTLSGH